MLKTNLLFFVNRKFCIYMIYNFLLSSASVFAVPSIFFFPTNYDGYIQSPQEISTQGDFFAICNGGTSGSRLAGLDLVRRYAGAASCPGASASSERFAEEVEYIFLVDDTAPLSSYVAREMQAQNVLEGNVGSQIIRPTILQFFATDDPGFRILIVGEMAYRRGSFTPQTWFVQLTSRFSSDAIVSTTNDYIRQCRANDVPIPPIWNPTTGTNLWVLRGNVERPFIATDLNKVQLWTYTSTTPAGICMALPRMDGAGDINQNIKALGIICQSETNGKTCFWDNVVRPTLDVSSGQAVCNPEIDNPCPRRIKDRPKIIGTATQNLMPTRMSDGYNLEENCTKCHRGSNAFITRLGTPLNVSVASNGGLDTVPARRYEPLSGNPADANWVNPISTVHPNMGGCLGGGCHDVNNEIAQPSKDYCRVILQNIIGTEMPPGGVFDSADISALVTACRTEGFTLNVVSQ